eukprot:7216593-Alexandrium_andersonii.AAC.1
MKALTCSTLRGHGARRRPKRPAAAARGWAGRRQSPARQPGLRPGRAENNELLRATNVDTGHRDDDRRARPQRN